MNSEVDPGASLAKRASRREAFPEVEEPQPEEAETAVSPPPPPEVVAAAEEADTC